MKNEPATVQETRSSPDEISLAPGNAHTPAATNSKSADRLKGKQMPDDNDEALEYINDMAKSRGYVLPYHKLMANADLDVLKAANGLVSAAYTDQRKLDKATKELIFITSLTVLKASHGHIAGHIRVALDLGVSPEGILEAIEIALPEAGVVAFQHGFEVWADVVGATGIEPTVDVHDSTN